MERAMRAKSRLSMKAGWSVFMGFILGTGMAAATRILRSGRPGGRGETMRYTGPMHPLRPRGDGNADADRHDDQQDER